MIDIEERAKQMQRREIKREIKYQNSGYSTALDEAILYTLHVAFGFGKKRLRRFYEAFFSEREKLKEYYEMPDDGVWLCHNELMKLGIDVEEWNKERESE